MGRKEDNKDSDFKFSNYCGLGGSGSTEHAVDRLCKEHDEGYANLQRQGINPYFNYNGADHIFLKKLNKLKAEGYKESIVQFVAKKFFEWKKSLAPSIDYENDEDTSQSNLLRGAEMSSESKKRKVREDGKEAAKTSGDPEGVMGTVSETAVSPIREPIKQRWMPETHSFEVCAVFYDYHNVPSAVTSAQPLATNAEYKLNGVNGVNPLTTYRASASTIVPRWWDVHSQYYNYYTVLKVDWKFELLASGTAINTGTGVLSATTLNNMVCHIFMCIGTGTTATGKVPAIAGSTYDELMHNQTTEYLGSYRPSTPTSDFQDYQKFEGTYVIGSKKSEIASDAAIEQWTAIASNPSFRENLCFYIVQEGPHVTEQATLLSRVTLNYTVQCKDLIDAYQVRKYTLLGVGSANTAAVA